MNFLTRKLAGLVVLLITFLGLVLIMPFICKKAIPASSLVRYKAPGRYQFYCAATSSYTLYYEDDIAAVDAAEKAKEGILPGLKIEIREEKSDHLLTLDIPKKKDHYREGNRKGISKYRFEVNEPGYYGLWAYYEKEEGPRVILAIRRGTKEDRHA